MSDVKARMEPLLQEMDALFDGFFEWIEGQYDAVSGGFFYARSSKTSGRFQPDIESTSQAINILQRCGLLDGWKDAYKQKAASFFRQKQDPQTGYYYDANPAMREDEVMVGRAISYSTHSLKKLGSSPLYSLPDRHHAAPDYMRTPQAYREWLHSIPLSNSWRGCDRLCNSAPYLGRMNLAEREPYLREAFAYFQHIQDTDTGLWGEGSWYVRVSWTFKLHTFYERFGVPMPRAREMYQSILFALRNETARDMCYIRNPISLLSAMKVPIPLAELEEIAVVTTRNMSALKRSDGGFSREIAHSPTAPNVAQVKDGEYYPDMPQPVHLGLGLQEGDMNAGTQALLIRWLCYGFAGLPMPPLSARTSWFAV